jgi:hypothetical protein
MRELARRWALLTGVISAAALLAVPGVWASHDAACQLLGTSAQRPKSVACNPRQNCFNATPGNPACNAAPTSGECPGTETYNPRQECLAKLPALPAVSIMRVEGGAAGENRTYAGRPDVLRVQGQNVGMAGNTAVGEAGLVVSLVPAPNCAPPGCVGLAVQSQPNTEGVRRFQLRAGHGHSQAEGAVQVVAAAPVQASAKPEIAMPSKAPERMFVTPAGPTPIPVPYPNVPSKGPAGGVAPQPPQPSPACKGNPAQVSDCQGKLAAYKTYMANLSRDVPLHSLPAIYVDLLKPLYPNVDLSTVRFGYSNRQQTHNATTDCNRIYFNSDDYVKKLAAGAVPNTNDQNPLWLYHELRHTEQCAEWGGRDFYAAQWFKDFGLAVVQTQLQANPQAFMKDVHDKQAMEVDANARMRVVEKALPDGLTAQGTAGRR